MMKRTTPDPKTGARRCRTDRTENRYSNSIIHQLPVLSRPRPGILGFRQERDLGDFRRTAVDAVDGLARLMRLTGLPPSLEAVEAVRAYIARGCIPA